MGGITGFMKVFRQIRLIGAALLLLTLIGMAGFHFIEGWPWWLGCWRWTLRPFSSLLFLASPINLVDLSAVYVEALMAS